MKIPAGFIVALLVAAGCAGQRPPEGGPLDTVPPEVISVYPAPNTVNYNDSRVAFGFNEYVDRRSVEEAIFISPNIEDIEFDWSGTEVALIFHEELRKNTTYVITVGTDVVDVRNRNRMARAFTISFSTGEKIDNGMIKGKVFDEIPQGVMIFSYRMNELLVDTLNPMVTKPDYITQTGTDGSFTLTNLAPGSYRLFAIKDEYRNLLYDPEVDAAGTAAEDITLSEMDSLKTDLQFIIAKEDTTPPRISSVTAPDDRHVFVQFSERIDSLSVRTELFSISDTMGRNTLKISEIFKNSIPLHSYTLITDKQKEDFIYVISVDSIRDNAGFIINPLARQKQFKGSRVTDTIPPALVSMNVKDGARRILPDREVEIQFSDALKAITNDTTFQLIRKKDSSVVELNVPNVNGTAITLKPIKKLLVDEQYILQMKWNGIQDKFGNHYSDSVSFFAFLTDDPERFGSIEGYFAGFGGKSHYQIQADNIIDKKQQPIYTMINEYGKFSFPMLPEGKYALKAFDDRNRNTKHDAGRLFPYDRSEKFMIYKDTIRVRPRWPVEGVIFSE